MRGLAEVKRIGRLVYETARLKSLKRRMTNSYKPIRKITFWVYNHRFTFGTNYQKDKDARILKRISKYFEKPVDNVDEIIKVARR